MHCEFGGQRTAAFEWLTTRDTADVEDGKIEVIGPDIDTVEPGGRLPLANPGANQPPDRTLLDILVIEPE